MNALIATKEKIVLVTGGGKYADLIRMIQRDWGLSRRAAHDMAIVTMDQTAALVADDYEKCTLANSEDEIKSHLDNDLIPVWTPYQSTKDAQDIEKGWKVTSDSLSLWLATQLEASKLFLVKSVPLDETPQNIDTITKDGLVDEAFGKYLKHADLSCGILCPNDWHDLDDYLKGNRSRTITLASHGISASVGKS